MVQQGRDLLPLVGMENHDHHHLARRGGADDHVAHQPPVLARIVERIAVFEAETPGFFPDRIRRIGLQPAFFDVQHFVEHTGDVESQRRGIGDLALFGDLLVGEPAPLGEGELQLVAVKTGFGRGQAGRDFRQLDLTDTGKLVAHLLGLETQLFGVGQILPLAAAADPEMGAERLFAQRRALHIIDDETFHIPAALGADLHIDHVARHGHRHEDHHVVVTPHRLAFGGQRRYLKPLDQGIIRFLSSHIAFGFRTQRYEFSAMRRPFSWFWHVRAPVPARNRCRTARPA